MNCDRFKSSLSLFLYGELSFEEEEAVHQHLETCAACRAALDREKALHEALDQVPAEPPEGLLAECRLSLKAELRRKRGVLQRIWEYLGQPVPPTLLRPAGALVLVALGFFAGRLAPPATPKAPAPEGPVATRVRYLEPDPSGGVRVGVDETWQRVLTGRVADNRIQQLVLAAAQDASDPGLRLDSLGILQSHSQSPEVQQALLQAVQHDPNAGVRLKAIEGLKPFAGDPETQSVLAKVLLSDDNLGVRTQAIDLLVQHKDKDMALAGVLQQLMQKEPNSYIRLRGEQALEEMNASPGPF